MNLNLCLRLMSSNGFLECCIVLMLRHKSYYSQYNAAFKKAIRAHQPKAKIQIHPYREWQKKLADHILEGNANSRTIIFVVAQKGNMGKSLFAHAFVQTSTKRAQIIIPSKEKVDLAYDLMENPEVVIFDCPRSKQGEFVQCDFLRKSRMDMSFPLNKNHVLSASTHPTW